MLLVLTEIEAVGAAGGGGGGGGGGAAFLWQAPKSNRAPIARMSDNHFIVCFTLFPPCDLKAFGLRSDEVLFYFQLQLGCELCPLKVNC
jgi:hypothetical protein